MTEHVVSVKLLDDITECPICTESFNDPRSLPCIHTFCLACISKWSGDKLPADNVDCPLCRKEFTIPANGLTELPKNIFIGKLLTVKGMSGARLCDWCIADSKIPVEKKNKAKQFCIDCRENLCESCVDTHSKLNLCRSHRTRDIGEIVPDTSIASLPTRCDKHPAEDLKLFCMECKEALCLICHATKHNGHKSAEIEMVADGFRRDINGNISQLKGGVNYLADLLSTFQIKRQDIGFQADKVEAEISSSAEHLKLTVERHKQKLITELSQFKTEKLKEVDKMVNELTQNKALIESLMKYSEELVTKGSNSDIAREISLLNLRVADMKQLFVCENAKTSKTTRDTLIIFVSSAARLDTSRNAVGRLKRTEGKVPYPTLCFALLGNDRCVDAVTSFNNQLFVTRHGNKQVEVYDSSTFNLLRLIKLPDDADVRHEGLAVCSLNDCLYVSDWHKDKVYKVNLSASYNSATTKWSVARKPAGLSVNKSHNLLVACFDSDKVQEYTSTGKLAREIENVVGVRHAVELNDGTLVVSQAHDEVNGVSILSLDGTVLRRYLPVAATISPFFNVIRRYYSLQITKQMNDPQTLAVDRNGFILVADRDNNRILVLNPELTDARPLPLTLDTPLGCPFGLWFEGSRGRLYVGEDGGKQRVLAFDNVFNVHTLFKR